MRSNDCTANSASTRYTRVLVSLCPCIAVLCGCPDSSTPNGDPPPPDTLQGTVWSKSDVAGLADSPFKNGLVFAATIDQLIDLSGQQGLSVTESLQFLRFTVSFDSLNTLATAVSSISSDGTYRLAIDVGLYAVCVAMDPAGEGTAAVTDVLGCLDVKMHGDTAETVNIDFGEGGVTERR